MVAVRIALSSFLGRVLQMVVFGDLPGFSVIYRISMVRELVFVCFVSCLFLFSFIYVQYIH